MNWPDSSHTSTEMNDVDMNQIVGSHDLAFVVLDALRFDVAHDEMQKGQTPNLSRLLSGNWQKCHSPGSFTFASHSAFFAGFLPTPADPNVSRNRLFASSFGGSETTGPGTFVFDEPDWISALRARNYHTICIGGVGFFNKETALSKVFPDLFDESHWTPEMGVTGRHSTDQQFQLAREILWSRPDDKRNLLYLNLSAIHQPNCHYLGHDNDSLESHAAALREIDSKIPHLVETLTRRKTFLIICSDHGTLYGEDGFTGHRVAHEAVYTVPYAHLFLPPS